VRFTDHHVHLDLVDPSAVAAGGLARVLDLGSAAPVAAGDVEVVRAGRMLTAPGGYPSTRPWAANGLYREVGADDVDAAVAEQIASGAAVIKIALNAVAGPVWPDEVLTAVVETGHAAGLHVIAHAEGAGQATRALMAGVDAFAHAPFTERIDDSVLAAMAARTIWISTLRIHAGPDLDRAVDNVGRFHAAGGRIRYGTDMGNGPSSGGVERDELELLLGAGLTRDNLLVALTGDALLPGRATDDDRAALDAILG
jgi:imidazolonepropionase-like amidohydrolase